LLISVRRVGTLTTSADESARGRPARWAGAGRGI